jgi:TolB-like protein
MAFQFDDYMLDPGRRELSRGPEPVAMGPQVFDLLVYLVENRDHVVSKDNILDAVWDGRIVSESTLASHINAVRKAIGDSGEEQRLIRTVARKGFRFVGDVKEAPASNGAVSIKAGPGPAPQATAKPSQHLALPSRPSIAVLPFVNLSGDMEQDYFADGVVEDIIGALSRIGWLFVIARNSSFAYKDKAVDVKQVGRELGVRYVLEGSVRKAANRMRITGQLIDAATGTHIGADRFEGTLEDIFDLQDRMSESIVGAIAPQLERAEIERAVHMPTDSLDAYDYYLRGMANFHRATREAIDEALPLFRKAFELDPDYAAAYGMASWCIFWRKLNGWMGDRAKEIEEGALLARSAVELGKNDAIALTRGGHALGHFGGELNGCIALVDKALVLNPNLAAAWYLGAWQRIARGEPDVAIERFQHVMRLSPLDPEMLRMQAGMAAAHLLAGRFDVSSSWTEKALRELPSFGLAAGIGAASYALAGRMEEAWRAIRHLRQVAPQMRLSNLEDWIPLRRPQDLELFADGLRKAGLPE